MRRGALALLPCLLPAQQQVDVATVQARAGSGDAEAQNLLGNLYTSGNGVVVNFATALGWYQKAAEKGLAVAQFNLGLVYELGRGVQVDERRAFRYYLLAAEQGFPAAQFNVGNMYATGRGVGRDFFESTLWFRQAADKGVIEAQYNLGLAYETGRGVLRDDGQAARWYKLAADRGFALGQYRLGLMCEEARGVEKNLTAAVALYRAAAEQGHAPAQNNLGLLYASGGGGLPADPVQALAWMSLAVEKGESPQGRDALAQKLTAAEQAAAAKGLADLRARLNPSAPPAQAAQGPAPTAAPSGATDRAYVDGLEELIARLRDANDHLSQANQRLAVEKARLEQRQDSGPAQAKQLEDLRTQGTRLAGLNQQLTAEKEAGARELGALQARMQEAAGEIARLRQAVSAPAVSDRELAALRNQTDQLQQDKARAEHGLADLRGRLDALTQRQAETERQLAQAQQENARLAAATPATEPAAPAAAGDAAEVSRLAAQLAERDNRLRNLQRDNERLNDDVKRSTRELLSLNGQLRGMREQLAKSGSGSATDGGAVDAAAVNELKRENARLARAAAEAGQQVRQLESDNTALQQTADNLQKSLQEKPAVGSSDAAALAEARQKLAHAQTQAAEATQRLERHLQDARVAAARLEEENRALQEAQKSSAAVAAALTTTRARVTELAADVESLQGKVTAGEQQVKELEAQKTGLAATAQRLEQTLQERPASRPADARALAELRQQLGQAEKRATEADQLDRQLGEARTAASRLETENRALREIQKTSAANTAALTAARARVTELTGEVEGLQSRLAAAERESGKAMATDATVDRLRQQLAEANAALEKSGAAVAELTGENDRLERDLESARKGTEAALAAQQQAVTAAQPDAYQMEIRTLQDRVKQMEDTLAEDRTNSARELATLATQLQKTREANQALHEANRALLAVKQADDTPSRAELDEALARVRDLTAVGDELRRQVQELADAKVAAEEQAGKATADLIALQTRLAEADKAAESHGSSVAELTGENERLARARDALRAENQRLAQATQSAEQQRLEAERSASLNVNAMAAQLAELRRDLDNVRGANARLLESNTALERERTTAMAQWRGENAALAARLAQAQSTLDQIASAARLGTPASQIASGGSVPAPAPPAGAEPRFHVVAEGDSLSRISLRYYGTAARWQEIYEANRNELRGANTLRLGQRLRIP